MTVAEALRSGARQLAAAGIGNPRQEARALLAHATRQDIAWVIAHPGSPVDTAAFGTSIARRAAHEPLAYILGQREFWSLAFQVSPATLIPRADSETLIEAALAACTLAAPRVLDLGTGTGCLLLALLHERPGATGLGIDIAPAAAALAARNAHALGMAGRALFLCANWDRALRAPRDFDLVLCNPPYIASADIPTLMPDVAAYEPLSALDGGTDGLNEYRRVMAALPNLLRPDGVAVLELGIGQGPAVAILAAEAGFIAAFQADLAGIDRAIVLRLKKSFGTGK